MRVARMLAERLAPKNTYAAPLGEWGVYALAQKIRAMRLLPESVANSFLRSLSTEVDSSSKKTASLFSDSLLSLVQPQHFNTALLLACDQLLCDYDRQSETGNFFTQVRKSLVKNAYAASPNQVITAIAQSVEEACGCQQYDEEDPNVPAHYRAKSSPKKSSLDELQAQLEVDKKILTGEVKPEKVDLRIMKAVLNLSYDAKFQEDRPRKVFRTKNGIGIAVGAEVILPKAVKPSDALAKLGSLFPVEKTEAGLRYQEKGKRWALGAWVDKAGSLILAHTHYLTAEQAALVGGDEAAIRKAYSSARLGGIWSPAQTVELLRHSLAARKASWGAEVHHAGLDTVLVLNANHTVWKPYINLDSGVYRVNALKAAVLDSLDGGIETTKTGEADALTLGPAQSPFRTQLRTSIEVKCYKDASHKPMGSAWKPGDVAIVFSPHPNDTHGK